VHPDFDAGPPGLCLSASGRLERVDGDAAIRQSVLLLLSTSPGERVMRPEYGCDLRQLIFSPNDATTAGLAIHYVRQAIARWEPRVEVLKLDAGRGGKDGARLEIHLEYRVRATRRVERLGVSVDLTGEAP